MRGWRRGVAALLALMALQGCYGIRVATHGSIRPQYRTLARPKIAPDDLDVSGLRRAALASRKYFTSTRAKASYALGRDAYTIAASFVDGPPEHFDADGATGHITLGPGHEFQREGVLGVYRDGALVPIDSTP